MTVATLRRPSGRWHTTPMGTGELSRVLEDARDLAELHDFCSAHACTSEEVSIDGKRLSILLVFELMRKRGFEISSPERSQHQPKKGFTAWLVDVVLPDNGPSLKLGFYTPDTS